MGLFESEPPSPSSFIRLASEFGHTIFGYHGVGGDFQGPRDLFAQGQGLHFFRFPFESASLHHSSPLSQGQVTSLQRFEKVNEGKGSAGHDDGHLALVGAVKRA